MKPVLKLYESIGTGIIVAFPSGVSYSNQTGGTFCLKPEIEGVYVPVRNDYLLPNGPLESPEIELSRYFVGLVGAIRGLKAADADFIDSILHRVGLHTVTVDRSRLAKSHEAWIHVVIAGDEDDDSSRATFSGFSPYPRQGILTWCNSD